ncbi:MAG: hypothetical protein QW625_02215 [Candidatus Nanoarchaeia archaeon]
MKIILVAHTETFEVCKFAISKLISVLEKMEPNIGKIKFNWMLEQDNMLPYNCEIRSEQDGRTIEQGKKFFNDLISKRPDELGIHVHFTRNGKFDASRENQERLLKNAHNKFVEAFGFEPKSFVGGWWYSDYNTLRILRKLKFKVDASPLPLYKEMRIRWLFGKIPLPSMIKTCDWQKYNNRIPRMEGKILRVPNAVDPEAKEFSINKVLSLDRLEHHFFDSIKIFEKFVKANIPIITIPFHPHSVKNATIVGAFFKKCNEIKKIEFVTLQEVYRWIKNEKN